MPRRAYSCPNSSRSKTSPLTTTQPARHSSKSCVSSSRLNASKSRFWLQTRSSLAISRTRRLRFSSGRTGSVRSAPTFVPASQPRTKARGERPRLRPSSRTELGWLGGATPAPFDLHAAALVQQTSKRRIDGSRLHVRSDRERSASPGPEDVVVSCEQAMVVRVRVPQPQECLNDKAGSSRVHTWCNPARIAGDEQVEEKALVTD